MVFKLSNDLRQYFTDEIVDTSDNEIITMLQIILGYQENADDLIDYLEESIDMLADVIQEETADIEFLNTHLFFDVLNEDIYTKIFSSFLKYEDFDLKIVADNILFEFYDTDTDCFVNIENEFPLQIRKEIKDFYEHVQGECYFKNKFDVSLAETLQLRIFWLNIKNKSIARKLRKSYREKSWFYMLCNELDFYMLNGQFVFLGYAYIEGYGFYQNYINTRTICNAIEYLNWELKTTRIVNPGIAYVLDEAYLLYRYNSSIIERILKIMDSKSEVII